MEEVLDSLRQHATAVASRAHVPYSGRREAAVLLLADGTWVPGVRVESASFSLTIPALLNAYSTAVASSRRNVRAVVLTHPARPEHAAFLAGLDLPAFEQVAPDALVIASASLPMPGSILHPFLDAPVPSAADAGIRLARTVAERAFIPESNFPVGCVLGTGDGRLVPGVNVEHSDWTRVLCAERNALGTAVTWGLDDFQTLYLSCPHDPRGTPCGACRQVIVELAPSATLWMDRGGEAPEAATPAELLPGAFNGRALSSPSL